MRGFSKLAVYSVIGAMSACVAGAAAASTWMYNGSRVSLEESGTKRRIVFDEPASSLEKAGVKRGTVLFEGETKKNGRVSGYAKLFKPGCDPLDYFVEGAVDNTKGEIVLQGQAPVFSNEGCKIKGYSEDSAASSLSFSAIGGGRGSYASRGADQGDGGYERGGQGAQVDSRYGQGNDGRGTDSQGQRDAYANNGDGRHDSRQGSGTANGQYDSRQGNGNANGQDGATDEDSRYASRSDQRSNQRDQRDDQADDDRYVERRSSDNNRDEYDSRYGRSDPRDAEDDYEERTYRYRYYRRPYDPDWRR